MKNECSIVKDLLPLYAEELASSDTAQFVSEHLKECEQCQKELDALRDGSDLAIEKDQPLHEAGKAKPFKRMMKRMNRQFYLLAYSLVIIFIFLGFSWTGGENLMYNSLIMPIVGIFGYYVFRLKAIFKLPLLLLIIDSFLCLFRLVELDLYSAVVWTLLYSMFVLVGIAIAFLLHYAFRKENDE